MLSSWGRPLVLTAALSAEQAGVACTVLEKDSIVGGIFAQFHSCHSGYRFDIGGHRFFTQGRGPSTNVAINPERKTDFLRRNRLSRTYYITITNSFVRCGSECTRRPLLEQHFIFCSYLWASSSAPIRKIHLRRGFQIDLEDVCSGRFQAPTPKSLGIPVPEITADKAAQRIKKIFALECAQECGPTASEDKLVRSRL